MIKSFSASTREIDDAQLAVGEITNALDLDKNLLKNSLGIISCFSEFHDTGVLKAICDALPFDCIGATSCLSAAGGEVDQIILTITVLTSDDCSFQTAEIPVTENLRDSVAPKISEMNEKSGEKPKLLLTYFPLINTVGGDVLLKGIDEAAGGVPLFGTIAVDHTMDFSTSKTILNGMAYRESVVLGAVYGNVNISFEVASLNGNKVRKQKAIITASEGNILTGVNSKPVLDYLEEIGLTKHDLERGLPIIPLIVDFKDSTKPVARAIYAMTPEGYAVCGGLMPVGATLAIGRLDMDDVLITTDACLSQFTEKDCTVLCYSCLSRYLALGTDNNIEAEKVDELTGDSTYNFAYSGGEICPLPDENGRLINYFHNYSIIFCKIN
ncbi:MAG: FIST C-terminal domain-containing protein [Defluviitaleaceae bacterium]|nr:FIST C-terminal domain-containing protein [Defluviitaleaceae bacterium]MCL2835366.1 FIST C-terminal domain-containing protein [Defluviitaleaceae bacterium]